MTVKTYSGDILALTRFQIYVFGSNTQGRHGMGSALFAKIHFGAIYGQAEGLQGKSYAIITKDLTKKIHPSRTPEQILDQIVKLYIFAEKHPHLEFLIAYNCKAKNLNAYSAQQMAKMFSDAAYAIPNNIVFEENFSKLLSKNSLF